MIAILAIIVAVAIVMLLIASPAFRYVFLIGGAVLIGGAWLLLEHGDAVREARQMAEWKAEKAKEAREFSLISKDDLKLKDVVFSGPYSETGGETSWYFKANIKNPSKTATIRELHISFAMFDCLKAPKNAAELSECDMVGEDRYNKIELDVPPGQTRGVDKYSVWFKNAPPAKGKWVPRFSLNAVRSAEKGEGY